MARLVGDAPDAFFSADPTLRVQIFDPLRKIPAREWYLLTFCLYGTIVYVERQQV